MGWNTAVLSLKQQRAELKQARRLGELDSLEDLPPRPRTRAECHAGERPCPFVTCKYNLYLDVNPKTGSVQLNFPGKELKELAETCALDVADRGGATLAEVGALLNVTRERTRQLEARAVAKLQLLPIAA